jgi:ABC-type branched-subunit amino acid transport system substrate-binding protein
LEFPNLSVIVTFVELDAAWNYFMTNTSNPDVTNSDVLSRSFIKKYREKFGDNELVNDPMEAAYINVHMWALAVEKAQSFDVDKVRQAAYGIVFDAPEGPVTMQSNHHISKYGRVGQFTAGGLFNVVWSGTSTVYPVPWNQYIADTLGKKCDHSRGLSDDSQFSPNQKRVGLLVDSDHLDILNAQLLALDIVNINRDGINGIYLTPILINVKSFDTPKMNLLTKDVVAIFGTNMNNANLEKWTPVSEKLTNQVIEFYPTSSANQKCRKNVINYYLSAEQTLGNSTVWLTSNSFDGFYYFGDTSEASQQQGELISKLLAEKGVTQIGVKYLAPKVLHNSDLISARTEIINSGKKRIVFINGYRGDDVNTQNIFADRGNNGIHQLKGSGIGYKIFSLFVSEKSLTAEMSGHYSVSSYFSQIEVPENNAFLSTYIARFGSSSTVDQPMVSAYNSILLYSKIAGEENTFDPVKVRVNLYDVPVDTPMGQITVRQNNGIKSPYRIAQVVTAKVSYYRLIIGSDSAARQALEPFAKLEETDACFFGAVALPDPPVAGGRVFGLIVTIIVELGLIVAALYVFQHRKTAVIRYSGQQFLLLIIIGCMLTVGYVFTIYPSKSTKALCQLQDWPMLIGFFTVFGALIQKCHLIFEVSRKKRKLDSLVAKSKPIYYVLVINFVVVCYLIAKTGFLP